MEYRHEWKFEISYLDLLVLRQRLGAVMSPDGHAVDGRYHIRSLYFDTPGDRALREKQDGVSRREKFRLRYYNGDTSLIRLEKKSKLAGLGSKETVLLTREEARKIVEGETGWMGSDARELVRELYVKRKIQGLEPRTVVDYTREPYVFEPGNVRVTLDYDIRTGLGSTDFLRPDLVTVPAGEAPILMEVKWDRYLPDIIRQAAALPGRRAAAFSKYAQGRIYG